MKKLNKMVYGVTEWEEDKGRDSVHVLGKSSNTKSNQQMKCTPNLYKDKP